MSEAPVSMVERVVLIVNTIERSSGPLTLGQISLRSGVPRSSAHRILQQLVDARWLQRLEGQYALGLRVFEIGSVVAHRDRISQTARPLMLELCRHTSHVIHLALLDGDDVVYLEKVGGAFASRLPSRVGGRLPAHCTAVGKAILAHLPRPELDAYLSRDLGARTSATITEVTALEAALQEVRRRGFAMESDEAVPGVACVAAPIVDRSSVVAAISVCGPRADIRPDELRSAVMHVAAEISRRLATSMSPAA